MKEWVARIISVLKANDYEKSAQRIKQAVVAKSWDE